MLEANKTYSYFWSANETDQGDDVYIERIVDGIAYATSSAFGDLGPFSMKFDVKTGNGIGDYSHAHLKMMETQDMIDAILEQVEGYESSDKTLMIQDLLSQASTDVIESIMKKQGI